MCIIDSRTGWLPCLEPDLWVIYRDLAADRGMFYCGSTPSWPLMGWKVDDDQCDPALATAGDDRRLRAHGHAPFLILSPCIYPYVLRPNTNATNINMAELAPSSLTAIETRFLHSQLFAWGPNSSGIAVSFSSPVPFPRLWLSTDTTCVLRL